MQDYNQKDLETSLNLFKGIRKMADKATFKISVKKLHRVLIWHIFPGPALGWSLFHVTILGQFMYCRFVFGDFCCLADALKRELGQQASNGRDFHSQLMCSPYGVAGQSGHRPKSSKKKARQTWLMPKPAGLILKKA